MTKKKQPTRAELLRQWLKEHDLFNIAALCRRADYNRGAFSHWLEDHAGWEMGDDAVQRFESVLSKYGYNQQ